MNQDPSRPTYRGMLHCFTATLKAGAIVYDVHWGERSGRKEAGAGLRSGYTAALHADQTVLSSSPVAAALNIPCPALHAEGVRGLYAGFVPTWSRLAPWQLCFWVTYEELRRVAGLAGF